MQRALALAAATVSLFGSPLLAQAAWSRIYPPAAPPVRLDALMASHDASGQVLLLFGINNSGNAIQDAWRLQGGTWTQLAGTLPPWRQYTQLSYDSARQRIVLFGGANTTVDLNDTWEWDGVAWSLRNPAVKPLARHFAAMAFDPVRGVTVLFGGTASMSGTHLQDTWEWNGTSWVQRFPSTPPAAREQALLAFDPVNRTMLLHGGNSTTGQVLPFDDSWGYDGSAWQRHFPATPPPYRLSAGMACDTHRQRVLLIGGGFADARTWEWNGSQWQADLAPSPAPRYRFAMAYDGALRRTVVHGGAVGISGAGYRVNDTWTHATPAPATVVNYGTGCSGTAGVPQLRPAPFELPWLGDTVHHQVGTIPAWELGAIFVSSFAQIAPVDLASVGMPGCSLLLSPDVAEFRAAVAGGAAWTLTIPNTAALAGAPFYQQAFVFDAAANALGLAASNGIVVTPGIR